MYRKSDEHKFKSKPSSQNLIFQRCVSFATLNKTNSKNTLCTKDKHHIKTARIFIKRNVLYSKPNTVDTIWKYSQDTMFGNVINLHSNPQQTSAVKMLTWIVPYTHDVFLTLSL